MSIYILSPQQVNPNLTNITLYEDVQFSAQPLLVTEVTTAHTRLIPCIESPSITSNVVIQGLNDAIHGLNASPSASVEKDSQIHLDSSATRVPLVHILPTYDLAVSS